MENDKITRREFLKKSIPIVGGLISLSLYEEIIKAIQTKLVKNKPSKVNVEKLENSWKIMEKLKPILKKSAINLDLKDIPDKPYGNKEAILIQQNKNAEHNIEIMDYLLSQYGYRCQKIIMNSARKDHILYNIKLRKRYTNGKSKTIIYYKGHGKETGILGNNYTNKKETITPYELFNSIGKIKGKKAIIIDACHSGIFTKALDRGYNFPLKRSIENYVCIASCPPKNISINSPFLIKNKYLGQLTFGLYKLLNFAKEDVNLITGKIEISNETHKKYINELSYYYSELYGAHSKKIGDVSFEMQRVSDMKKFML
jgi:hypothetical protein